MLSLALKQVLAQRFRLLLTSLAVVLGVTFVSGTLVLTDTSRQLFDDQFRTGVAGTDLTVRTAVAFDSAMGVEVERDPVSRDVLDGVRQTAGVDAAVGVVSGKGLVVDGEPRGGAGPSLIMSWAPEPFGGFDLTTGAVPAGPGEIVLDAATARREDLRVGDAVTVQSDRVARMRVVGLAEPAGRRGFTDSSVALVSTEQAQQLLRLGDRFSEVRVTADTDTAVTDLRRRLAADLGGRYAVISGEDLAAAAADAARGQLDFLRLALLALAAAALLIGAYLIANTFTIVVAQRTRELALLRAAGATGRQVFRLLVGEALLVGLVGSAVGTALGVGAARVLRAVLAGFGVALPTGPAVIRPGSLLIAFGVGVVVTVVAAVAPSRRAARVSPLEAMRASASVRVTGRRRLLAGVVAALVSLGAGTAVTLTDGSISLVALAAVAAILALSALGPVLAGPLTRLLGRPLRSTGVSGHLAGEFAARAPRRTAATVMALTLSLSLIAFMIVLGASVKESIAGSYRETIGADYVVESSGGEMLGGLAPAVRQRLADLPEVSVASPIRFGHWKDGRATTALTAVDPDSIGRVATFSLRAGEVAALAGGGVVVAQQVADERRLDVGDTLPMTFARTGEQDVEVVGIFEDQDAQAVQTDYLVSLDTYRRHFTEDVDANVFVDLAPGVSAAAGGRAVRTALRDFPTADLRNLDAAVDGRTAAVDQILGLVTVLLSLTVLIALLGITNTLALSILERTREIGLLRAVGMTGRQLRWMVRSEAVLLAVLAVVMGLALGVGFAAVTLQALAGGDPVAVAVPLGRLLAVVAVAALAGLVAGLVPARRAARLHVLDAISTP